jgi:hypothetical protein
VPLVERFFVKRRVGKNQHSLWFVVMVVEMSEMNMVIVKVVEISVLVVKMGMNPKMKEVDENLELEEEK